MVNAWKYRGVAVGLAALVALLAAGSGRAVAAVDVMVIVVSSGKGLDEMSVTYAGPVTEAQAKQDLQALSAALGRGAAEVRVTTKRVAPGAPEMTSVEAKYPEMVNRAAGALPVQPFVGTYRRYSQLRLSFFVEPPFKLVSPARSLDSGDVQLTVDNQGPIVNYDVRIRHAASGAARIPALDGSDPWARLLGPGLFLAFVIAAGIGVAVFFLLRRSGAGRVSAR